MSAHKYLEEMKRVQNNLLIFLDNEDNIEENYQNLLNIFQDLNIRDNKQELKIFMNMVLKISNNHHRRPYFFNKIERILHLFKNDIKNYFSNSEIFQIFNKNKRLLLFFIEEKIMIIDKSIIDIFKSYKYEKENYQKYFYPEIMLSMNENLDEEITEDFKKNRKIGENDNCLCKLIRKDLIIEFIEYIKQYNLSLNSIIEPSIFETNTFLINQQICSKQISLIEYAAFYGSINIFNYLRSNNVQMTPSLWLYGIHGQNSKLLFILDENHIIPEGNFPEYIYKETIRCHHNRIMKHLQSNYFGSIGKAEDFINQKIIVKESFKYYNFEILQDNIENELYFYYSCKYDYFTLAEILIKIININTNNFMDTKYEEDKTALTIAIEKENIEIVKLLLLNRSDCRHLIFNKNDELSELMNIENNTIEYPKLLRVFYKGTEQRIKVFRNTSDSKIREIVKKLFKITEDESQIYFQDSDGDILILPSPIIDGLCVYIYVKPTMDPTPPVHQVSTNLLPGFKWDPTYSSKDGPPVVSNDGYTLGKENQSTGWTPVVSTTEYTKGQIYTKFKFQLTYYQDIGIVSSNQKKQFTGNDYQIFSTWEFFNDKSLEDIVFGAMYVNFDKRFLEFFWLQDNKIIKKEKRTIPDGPVKFYAYTKSLGITILEGGSSPIPSFVSKS